MPRISPDPPRTIGYRLGHNMQVGRSYAIFELPVERAHQLDRELKDLAVMAAAATIGCGWGMGFGHWDAAVNRAVPTEKPRDTANWRGGKVFSELELLVMEYAEAMTTTPPRVTDAMVDTLRRHLSEAQLAELTAIIAVENLRLRISSALRLTAQGSTDRGELPDADDPAPAGTGSRPGP